MAKAEEQLGGRFTDDAVLHLALVLAIMSNRIQSGNHLAVEQELAGIPAIGKDVARCLLCSQPPGTRSQTPPGRPDDIAGVAMEMMAAPRNDTFPGDLEGESDFSALSERLMEHISQAFGISKIKHDRTLQTGLLNNIVPACFRQRFNLWFPIALNNAGCQRNMRRNMRSRRKFRHWCYEFTGVTLPKSEINNLVVLLRAAFIRNRSYRFDRVIVICPSGMATAQLLMARLHARFPNLSNLEVISLRDLTPTLISSADLILTTVPLPRQYANNPKVIQVHPLLMPEDIETITQFLS